MRHQAEIDGLRAVAVLPVVFFHAGWTVFSGGYVGVDVFFVISGYLITRILAEEIASGRFSILNFYERRIRRIFPCLFAVLIASSVAAAFLLIPLDFRDFSKSVVATVFFASNVLFFRQSGYFDDQSAAKPMLHTWSLAVEEQFYIFFPILLWLIHRYARDRMFLLLVPLAILSFAASVWGVKHAPAFAFFMAPTRVWELFAGALLALGLAPEVESRRMREGLAWLGLGLILGSVALFTEETPFPGASALLPVIGASLLIQFARGTSVGWLLGTRPMVFVGLISYSLYLWHWPIVVFSEYYLVQKLTGWGTVAAVAASLIIATLSWRYVEQPFRVKGLMARRTIFGGAATAMASMVAVSLVALQSNGWAGRFPDEVARLESYATARNPRRECHRDEETIIALEKSCVYGAATPPAYAVWGDSYAIELTYALGELAGRSGQSVAQLTSSSCPPSLGLDVGARPHCREYNEKVARFLAGEPRITTIMLVAAYANHHHDLDEFSAGIRNTVDLLVAAGKRVVLVYPIPTASLSVPRTLARVAASGADLGKFRIDKADFLSRNAYAFRLLDSLAGVNVVRKFPHQRLCNADTCAVYADGAPLYYDQQHLSIAGAEYLATLFQDLFRPGAATSPSQADSRR